MEKAQQNDNYIIQFPYRKPNFLPDKYLNFES